MTKQIMLITGASRGIGAAIAWHAATVAGYAVCINYRTARSEAMTLVDEIVQAGGQAISIAADVSDSGEVARLFVEVESQLGRPDVLVNNAGIIGGVCPIEEVDEARLRKVFETNVYSAFFCSREFVRRASRKHGGLGGSIVNLSSVASRLGGMPKESFYAATKGALDSFTIALAKEVGAAGIRVNALRPGIISTDIHQAHGGHELLEALASSIPLGRVGTPHDVAEAVLWLCSESSSYVHGALLDISGGR